MMRYKVVMIPHADEGVTAAIPTLPGCVTEGDSFEDALAMAHEAAHVTVCSLLAHGDEVPTEPDGTTVAEIEIAIPELARA